MNGKDNDTFGFRINDPFEDISSSSKSADDFEDIVSDTSRLEAHADNIDVNCLYEHRYYKKKHGIAGFFQKIGIWWTGLTRGKRAAFITGISLLLVICIGLGILWPFLNYNYNDITEDPNELGFDDVIDKKIINIALFGIDTRNKDSFKGLSDSIMILSLNTEKKTVKVISIMRDTFVPIERNGKTTYGKINSCYNLGGPELAIKTLNQVFGLDISEYATINFFGMVDIIDAVGGIDITVTQDELTWKGTDNPNLNNCMDEICAALGLDSKKYHIDTAGEVHANGVQAVAYARVRHCKNIWGTNNDYGRTDRQRHVMSQLFSKATTLKKTEYVRLAKALIPCSETSLSYSEIMSLATSILLKSPTFEQYRLTQDNFVMPFNYSGYGSVVYIDLDYAADMLHGIIYDDMTMDEYVEANGIGKNDWFASVGSKKPSGSTPQSTTSDNTPGTQSPGESSSNISSSGESSVTSSGTESPGESSGGENSGSASPDVSSGGSSSGTENPGEDIGGDSSVTRTE